ncbi:class B sortase, LPKTxAVK-specific [Streptococcus cuniculipharyngis]|nr:class B sortase, LPKTxAVK-specific [Streptococcus cuniculipharyngis]
MSYRQGRKKVPYLSYLLAGLLGLVLICGFFFVNPSQKAVPTNPSSSTLVSSVSSEESSQQSYEPTAAEKAYLAERFAKLSAINPEVIAYVYAPGTKIDEPVVQTGDNSTYLDKTFEGAYEPYMGAVFMDTTNKQDFSDSLTWLFGHARGSLVPDSRMFNDLNFYDSQAYFDSNPYLVIETAGRNYYYEATYFIIVPETTDLYRTSFETTEDFRQQLERVAGEAKVKKADAKIDPSDKYLVLSTCREEDGSLRANLYLRQIPDNELPQFLAKHADKLAYEPTR